ncbi:MAG: DoxX family protein [Bacteroidaceae bacterium]|nr:DoxX family protein [Bacteroidaceae bacterium]
MKTIIVNVCRFLLAATFLFSGFVKANDPYGMAYKLSDYFSAFGLSYSEHFCLVSAVVLALVEWGLGIGLFFALSRRITSFISLIFMLAFTALTGYILVTGAVSDCGCFGDAIVLTNGQTFAKNIVLLAAAAVCAYWPSSMFHIIPGCLGRIIRSALFLALLVYALVCIYTLPLIDFRPYRVGYDMNELVDLPVEGVSGVKVPRYDAAGFYVQTATEGEDVTENIFSDDKAILIIAPDLTSIKESYADEINTLYDFAIQHHYSFYFITASSEDLRQDWKQRTSAHYPFYISEDRILKTVIRANPGLVVITNGTITTKSSHLSTTHLQ